MLRRVLLAALLGGVTLFIWAYVANGIFRFTLRTELKSLPYERAVYDVLVDAVKEPGVYIVNPEVVPDVGFPAGKPVFGIRYGGVGHEIAGRMMWVDLARGLLGVLLAAALLATTSDRILSRYWRRALFVVGLGVLLVIFGDVPKYGIGNYPTDAVLALSVYRVVTWALIALVMAAIVRTSGSQAKTT